MARLSHEQCREVLYDWRIWARSNQVAPPGNWRIWLLLAGRGFGKSRSGAEWVREQVEKHGRKRLALVAPTAADARDVMVEGESGIIAISPPDNRPLYQPSIRRLVWPNGALATTYSADEPERLRGPQHDSAWCDEVASWRYPEAWDMLMMGLRLGADPRCVVTTTPKPVKLVKDLLKQEKTGMVAVTRGTTYENRANLADAFFEQIIRRYEGTRLGEQELKAAILDDMPGALWNRALIEQNRRRHDELPELTRVVVAMDPAATSTDDADEMGIVVAGLGADEHGYVLADRSTKGTPNDAMRKAILAFDEYRADRLVAEVNNGGEWIESVARFVAADLQRNGSRKSDFVAYGSVHASRGKITRAEPISALYEQGRVHHVGMFGELEDQMCGWLPGMPSPDRMDALVWALTFLMLETHVDVGPVGSKSSSYWRH